VNFVSNPFSPPSLQPLLIVISGPSGVGKDAAITLMKKRSPDFHFVVTVTTRPPRTVEVHGRDYFFVSHEEFARMVECNEFLEHAKVYDDYKGIPKAQVQQALASGKDVVMRIDVQGAATIHLLYPDAVLIFITAQNEEEMVNRLRARNTETPDKLELRIATSIQELNRLDEFKYVVVNQDTHLDDTVDTILAIIRAEHHRVKPRKVTM